MCIRDRYVLNLATNDVGGRVYVSAQIGSDLNDGRSAVNPVRTIKKAAQIAWSTPGIKETLIVSGGDYVEDNPISLPPDCSVVGDNLRLVIIRPANLGKHIFKFGDKNYVTGVTYRDKVDSNGDSIGTWDFAMVFDDKQRIIIDNEVNGDFGVEFPIGHQVFGPQRFRIGFQNNTGLALLQTGVEVVGLNTGARASVSNVTFNSTTGANAYVSGNIDVQIKSGALIEGDQYSYITSAATGGVLSLTISSTAGENKLRFTTDPTTEIPVNAVVFLNDADNSSFTSGYYQVSSIDVSNAPTYWDVQFVPILGAPSWDTTQTETISINSATPVSNTIDTVNLKSIRAEGEVVSYDTDVTSTLPISRIDFSLQGDPSIATGGFQDAQFGNAEDLGGIVFYTSALVGRTNFHEFKEGQEIIITGLPTVSPDLSFLNGKQRIYKVIEDADGRARRFVIPKKLPSLTTSNFNPGEFATVQSYSKSVTLSLLNSPNKFPLATPVERRFQDACQLIRNNRDYIAEEVVGIINEQFSKDYFAVYNIDTVNNTFDIFLGTTDHVNTYVSGGTVTYNGNSYAISNFVYDNSVTGVATITTTNAGVNALSEDAIVKLADILISCSAGQKIYPSYSSPTSGNNTGDDGDEQCKQDVIHFLNALVRDLEFGSNHNILDAAKKYIVDGKITYIEDEIIQNVRAIEYARELAIYAMCNWRIRNRTTNDPLYTTKHATSTRYTDPTIISATAGNPACDDVRSAIDTLSFLWVDVISNNASGTYIDAAYLIARNADVIADQALIDTEAAYPTLNLSDLHQRKCRRDIKIVLEGLIRDLVLGGNHGIVSTAEAYFSGTVLSGISEAQRPQTIYAFQRVKLYAIYAMRNWSDGNVLQTTPTGSTYVPTTGAMTVVIPDPAVAPVANSDRIAFSEEALTYSCAYNGGGNDSSPYRTDIAFGKSFLITNVISSGGSTTISLNVGPAGSNTDAHTFVSALTNGTKIIYGPITLTSPIPKFEDWSILNGPGNPPIGIFTPTDATYDPASGDLTFTTASAHNLTTSNSVRFQPESLVFTCDMDNDATEHKYPKDGQPAYGNNLVITGTTTNTVTVNVGASGPDVQFTPSAATYDPATGIMVMEVGSHTLDVGEGVVIADNSLSFTCDMDGNTVTKTYPRPTIDRVGGRSIPITGKTATSISVNVGVSPANKLLTAQSGTTYDPATGNLVLQVGQHGIGVGRNIILEDNAVTFTCDMDNNYSNHSYPRSTDPASGSSLSVTSVGTTSHTVTDAPYDAATGVITFTLSTHGFSTGDYIKIDDDALTYTCAIDGGSTNHSYPRAGYDFASNRWLEITKIDNNTFSVNVGGSSYTGSHTFVSAATNGIKRQDGTLTVNVGASPLVSFTPAAGSYDPATGDLVLTIGTHTLTQGTNIKIADNSLKFKCSMDDYGTVHTYPRVTDPVSGEAIEITATTSDSITVNVGQSPLVQFTPTNASFTPTTGIMELTIGDHSLRGADRYTPSNASYNPTSGMMTITIADHGFVNGNVVRIDDDALTFTCGQDGNATQHSYPRSTDPVSGMWIPISNVTQNTFDVQVLADAPSTNTTPHVFVSADGNSVTFPRDSIKLADGAVTFTCDQDGNATNHSYPRTTIETATVTGADYNPSTGIMEITIANHGLKNNEQIKFADNSLTFTCAEDGDATNHTYPRSTDPVSDKWLKIFNVQTNTFQVQVLDDVPSTNTTTHTFVSATTNGLSYKKDPFYDNSIYIEEVPSTPATVTNATYNAATGVMVITSAGHGLSNGNKVKFKLGSLTFSCTKDGNATNHSYPRITDPSYDEWLTVSNKTNDTFEVNVGISGPNDQYGHTFVSATASGLLKQNGTIKLFIGVSSNTTTHSFVSALTNSVKTGGTYTHVFDGADANAVTSGGGYTHTFVSGLTGGVKFLPQTAHTFVSATTNAVSHLPQSTHEFKRANADSISAYSSTSSSANAICAGVESTIDTALELFEDILDGTIVPGSTTQTFGTLYDTAPIITYPDSYLSDFNNNRMAIRGDFDDFPIIEASPYTQNASVISFRGGGGALVDGSKVKQPNCPFPGLEPDGTASFPNQGKSMVAAAFTIVSFGGTGYKVIEDGYTQLVSVFVIFCQDGVVCESGGYASITNSATNFGTFALRGTGYREECYEFDTATVNVVSQTPTGRTTLTIGGIGREPLEHYILKVDGYSNADPDKEFFIDAVSAVTVGPPFSATITIDDGIGNGLSLIEDATGNTISGLTALQAALTPAAASNATIKLHRPSIVNSSSHTWEFAGSGNNYLALPENGGTKVEANEQVSENYGRVYVSGTDELGDFKVGTFARIENRTGNITFTGTVTISEVEFLKLKGGDVVVTGFDNSNTLGGANTSDSKLPTQKAVKDYITNNLGPYINKPYSTNAVPRALVELTDSGKISIDQIPALRPFQVFTVPTQADRLKIEGALAGDIAIQQDTSQSFILNNDLESLFLGFAVDSSLVFNINDVYTGSPSTGRIQATEYRQGVLKSINITDGGSGYTVAPTVTVSGGNPSTGAVAATAVATIANGEVVTITITENASYLGGFGYTTQPSINIQAPPGAGTQASATALIESRLYGNIVNNIKMLDTDTFDDSDSPSANTVNISRVVNTSSTNANNWVSLSSNQIAASDITSGVIETDRLATGGAANSFSFLRGDQNFAPAVQSIKGAETRYFARLYTQASNGAGSLIFESNSNALIGHEVVANVAGIAANTNINGVTTVGGLTTVSLNNPVTATIAAGTVIEFERGTSPLTFDSSNTIGNFIDSVVVGNPGSGYTDGQYFDLSLDGGAGNDLRVNLIVSGGEVTDVTVTNAGAGYTSDFQITPNPTSIGSGSNLVLLGKVSTVNKQFANVAVDVQRVSDLTISADEFGTIGVSRFKKSQFNIGTQGNGSITIKTGPDSGLDADLLDGQQGSYYLNGEFFVDSSIGPDKLASGTFSIDITGRSTNTLRVETGINNPTSNPAPSDSVQGLTLQTVFNSSNGLLTAFPSVDTGSSNSAKHLVMTLRNGESGIDATFGGVRQLAFGNDNRLYLRGSGDGVTNYGSWYEVWNSGNQGIDSGLDADKLDNKQGEWYQDGWNIKKNTIFDTRLPVWRSSTKFRNKIEVKSYTGTDVSYRILVRLVLDISPGGDFEPGSQINIYNVNKQDIGDFFIDNVEQLNDQNDGANSYTMLIGRLASGGNLETAVFVGVAGDEKNFENYEIFDSNTTQFAELGNSSGDGFLRLGRYDGNFATNPYIHFNSSQAQAVDGNGNPTYNSAIIADGGNATEGSGSLEVKVLNENEFKVNDNIIWNAGNVAFNSANIASTASLKSVVQRDTSGNFSAGTITADLTGAASLNVLKTGDTMTGGLTITGNNNLNIQGSGDLDVGGTADIGSNLTVDSGTFYVNATDNVVNVGQTTNANNTKFNVYTNLGTNFTASSALSSQQSVYQSSVYNQNNNGESGIILQHGASNAAQWGISSHYTGAYVGELIFRTRTAAGTSAKRLTITNGGDILPGNDSSQDFGADSERWQNIYSDITHALNSVRVAKGEANTEADLQLRGGGTGNGGGRGFRLGSNIGGGADLFEIYSSQTNGDDDWKSLASGEPALAIQGANNRVGINTNTFSGTDTSTTPNTTRNYILNVNGDMNLDGQLFQNNEEFVTSRWNEVGTNIYRNSRVGIGETSPAYTLDVGEDFSDSGESGRLRVQGTSRLQGAVTITTGGASITGTVNAKDGLQADGAEQWLDSKGVIKTHGSIIDENVTIPAGTNAFSVGDVTVAGGRTITVNGIWKLL